MQEEMQDSGERDRRRVSEDIIARLRGKGIRLNGRETTDELADLLDAVDAFEEAVERSGGDLMVDEPVHADSPVVPDDPSFALPSRHADESVEQYVRRIASAASRTHQLRRDD